MKCKNCPSHNYSPNKDICWRVWGLCGKCARQCHPHFYRRFDSDTKLRKRRTKLMNKIKHHNNKIKEFREEIDKLNEEIQLHENARMTMNIEIQEQFVKSEQEKIALMKMKVIN